MLEQHLCDLFEMRIGHVTLRESTWDNLDGWSENERHESDTFQCDLRPIQAGAIQNTQCNEDNKWNDKSTTAGRTELTRAVPHKNAQ